MVILKATMMVSLSTYSTKSLVQYFIEDLWAVEKIKYVKKTDEHRYRPIPSPVGT